MTKYLSRLLTLGTLLTSSVVAAVEPDSDNNQLEEIVVVARQRAEPLQTVPVSATAFTGSMLSSRGITDIKEVLTVTPNVSEPDLTGASNNVDIVIRGISTNTRNAGFESGAGVYVDGVYAGRSNGVTVPLVGIDGLEVLRGPQGTNFGKNTTAGAINIRTIQPKRDVLESGGELEYASFADKSGNAFVNLPLGNAAVRATVFGRKSNGYVLNVADGDHYANQGFYGGRLQTKLWLGERLDLTLSGDYRRDDHDANYPEIIKPGSVGTLVPGPYTESVDYRPLETGVRWGLNATLNYALGDYTLTSITGYRANETTDHADNDNSTNPAATAHVIFYDNVKHSSEEIRLASPNNGPITFVAGGYFLDMKIDSFRRAGFSQGDIDLHVNVHNQNRALYFDSQIGLVDRLKLDAGIRYTSETKHLEGFNQTVTVRTPGGLPAYFPDFAAHPDRLETNTVTPKAGLSFELAPDINTYFTFSRGYKSGGWNPDFSTAVVTNTQKFSDEKVDNYEVGIKSLLLDHRLRVNVAVFNMDFTNQQVQQQTGIRFDITNAGKSRIRGVESELAFKAADFLTLGGALGYIDAKYLEYPGCVAGSPIDCSGNRLINAPKLTASATLDLSAPLPSWGRVLGHFEDSYRSNYYAAVYNGELDSTIGVANALLVRPYQDLSASIGVTPNSENWRITFFVNNLLNRVNEAGRYLENVVDFDAISANYYPPRVFGVRFETHFSPSR